MTVLHLQPAELCDLAPPPELFRAAHSGHNDETFRRVADYDATEDNQG